MLSKCLNPSCHATFRTLERGRLFRIDFRESQRRGAQTGKSTVASIRSKTHPVEHFWLCEQCSSVMTVRFSPQGELDLVPLAPKMKSIAERPAARQSANAS